MATTTKLKYGFRNATGDTFSMSYSYIDPEASAADIKSAGQLIVTNGSIFENVPAVLRSAELITTTTTAVNLDA